MVLCEVHPRRRLQRHRHWAYPSAILPRLPIILLIVVRLNQGGRAAADADDGIVSTSAHTPPAGSSFLLGQLLICHENVWHQRTNSATRLREPNQALPRSHQSQPAERPEQPVVGSASSRSASEPLQGQTLLDAPEIGRARSAWSELEIAFQLGFRCRRIINIVLRQESMRTYESTQRALLD